MIYCTNCGNGNQESHSFCNKCGNKLNNPPLYRINPNTEIQQTDSPKFKRKYLYYIIISFVLFLTNPSEEQHEFAVNLKVSNVLRENYNDGSILSELGIFIGEGIANEYIKNRVRRQNLLLFSFTRIDGSICGIGFLDNVYLSPEVNRTIKSKLSSQGGKSSNSSNQSTNSTRGEFDNPDNSNQSTNSTRGHGELDNPDALPDH